MAEVVDKMYIKGTEAELGAKAANISVLDTADNYAEENVETVLAEIGTALFADKVLNEYTVAGLPVSPASGTIAFVNDSDDTITYRSIVTTGGGSGVALVFFDGTNWIYH
jgi:hypothetical protein